MHVASGADLKVSSITKTVCILWRAKAFCWNTETVGTHAKTSHLNTPQVKKKTMVVRILGCNFIMFNCRVDRSAQHLHPEPNADPDPYQSSRRPPLTKLQGTHTHKHTHTLCNGRRKSRASPKPWGKKQDESTSILKAGPPCGSRNCFFRVLWTSKSYQQDSTP